MIIPVYENSTKKKKRKIRFAFFFVLDYLYLNFILKGRISLFFREKVL